MKRKAKILLFGILCFSLIFPCSGKFFAFAQNSAAVNGHPEPAYQTQIKIAILSPAALPAVKVQNNAVHYGDCIPVKKTSQTLVQDTAIFNLNQPANCF